MADSTTNIDRRTTGAGTSGYCNGEETLVADSRASQSPSQIVEQRLLSMLKHSSLLVSHVQRRLKPGPR